MKKLLIKKDVIAELNRNSLDKVRGGQYGGFTTDTNPYYSHAFDTCGCTAGTCATCFCYSVSPCTSPPNCCDYGCCDTVTCTSV